MVFSSILFIFQFLPIALGLYYLVPWKFKNFVLFAVSLVFYSWGEVRYFPIMMATILVNYVSAILIERFDEKKALRTAAFLFAAVLSLGSLLFFKYLDFFTGNINALLGTSIPALNLTLPLGISFYTFQTLSYTIDVYLRKVKAEHNFIDLAAYVTLFPQLIAGPIVRYTDVAKELKERTVTREMLDDGMEDFIIGLAKKVLLANNIGALWTEVENLGFGSVSTGLAWLGILAFSLQIYFDFSGYSQMAIGLGRMMGFIFPKNFDDPYTSRSATEFWRRWHMTLGSWFREYLYFPLGGSRCGKWRTVFNTFVVWACTGFWHGASWNFILWGLYFFLLLTIERLGFKKILDRRRVFSHVYTLLILAVGWALFAILDFGQLGVFLSRLFVPTGLSGVSAPVTAIYYLRNYAVILALGCWFCTKTATGLYQKLRAHTTLRNVLLVLLFLVSVAYLVDSTYNPFLYFRF